MLHIANSQFPDDRTSRSFSLGEVAEILGVSGSYLRLLSNDGLGPTPDLGIPARRSCTLRQINELRAYLASARPKEALKFCPQRLEGESSPIREAWLKHRSLYESSGVAAGRSAYEQAIESLTSTNAEVMDIRIQGLGPSPDLYVTGFVLQDCR
uniref:Uncharacterized protein n=1 Tax=Rhizobium leguminosarum TaxID=384 RepID=A0A179BFU0_RHILE|nr:hypothetical protein A4U53_29275 [Rhizobium leguminosarum]